jgi:hypothetical protein|tara:strand:+ start:6492 stop:6809 length:318 start_codon:yes stop_codon:yes gene_type:complete
MPPKSQWTMENFHCKKIGSLSNKVIAPKGISKHHEMKSIFATLPLTIFSITTCNVINIIIAAVSIKMSFVVNQTPANRMIGKSGLLEIFKRNFKIISQVLLKIKA